MPPSLISHYRVVRRLGAGGMGEVFLAEDTQLDRSVALKLLLNAVAEDSSRRKRFLAEAKAASALNHPSVCIIYEVGETAEGQPFIAMEYLEGQTLEALTRHRRLDLQEIIGIGVQVADALEAARQHQVVHRDIKPGNIMVSSARSPSLQVKVLDFGLAKRLDQAGEASVLTQEGAIIGTPNYLSPEMALGREVDSPTDLFSLGVVLYELAAGRNPFAGGSFGETVNNILNKNPDSLKPWNPNVTPEFERIVFKCLEKDPTKRYATPAQLRDDLAKVQTSLQAPHTSNRRFWAVAAIVVAVGVIGLGALWLTRTKPETLPTVPARSLTPLQQNSVAVLPFVNLSADKADEYLSDGISEDLSTSLTPVRGLHVRPWQSCRALKGRTDDIRKIGEQLSVAMVLAGSVTKAGNRLRVNAQLSDVANDRQLWAMHYDREMADILEIRSDIARELASALKAQLGLEEAQRLVRKPTLNAGAYRLYLQGGYLWNRRTGESLKQAVEQFRQATSEDPDFALAYAGLADTYVLLSEYVGLPPREIFPKARDTARKALELDNTLPGPKVVLAMYLAKFEWKWEAAEAELRNVISAHPNYATARQWLAQLLEIRGKYSEALKEMRFAQEVDPVSPIILANVGWELFVAGQEALGVESLSRQVKADPSFPPAHLHLGLIYLLQDRPHEAIVELEKSLQLDPGDAHFLGLAYARAGKAAEARGVLAELQRLQDSGLDYRVGIALVQQALNDDVKAMDSLEKAVEEHSAGLEWLGYDPLFKDLRAHPRAQAVLRKMNLLPVSTTNAPAAGSQKTIAVLPFENLSGDHNDEYLCEGVAEDLRNALTKIKDLRVPAASSSSIFKGRKKENFLRNVGNQLHVDSVLEGSVRRAGDKLRVTAALVNVTDGFRLWSDTYDRDMTNIFAIQADIAARVAEALEVKLLGRTRAPTLNLEAYELYLRGRFLWNRRTGETLRQAVAHLQKAIDIDPDYALAYAGIADCYAIWQYTGEPTLWHLQDLEVAARRALALDKTLAAPHAALGSRKMTLRDWGGAEVELQNAIDLDPNYPTAHHWLSLVLRARGLYQQGLTEIMKAQELDPLSPVIKAVLAEFLFRNGKEDLAIETLKKQIRLDPDFPVAYDTLGWLYLAQGRTKEAVDELQQGRRILTNELYGLEFLAVAHACNGQTNEARAILDKLLQEQEKGRCDLRLPIAIIQYGLSDTNAALYWLKEALTNESENLEMLAYDRFWDGLRPHPQVQSLLKQIKLAN